MSNTSLICGYVWNTSVQEVQQHSQQWVLTHLLIVSVIEMFCKSFYKKGKKPKPETNVPLLREEMDLYPHCSRIWKVSLLDISFLFFNTLSRFVKFLQWRKSAEAQCTANVWGMSRAGAAPSSSCLVLSAKCAAVRLMAVIEGLDVKSRTQHLDFVTASDHKLLWSLLWGACRKVAQSFLPMKTRVLHYSKQDYSNSDRNKTVGKERGLWSSSEEAT